MIWSHRKAVLGMLGVTLMWSSAGVVTRWVERAEGLELTFWRSLATFLALSVWFLLRKGPSGFAKTLLGGGKSLLLSGVLWAVMFTCFMIAMSLTTVANVLITMSLGPLFTALIGRLFYGNPVSARTAWSVILAGCGIVVMYSQQWQLGARHWEGSLWALAVPVAGALNWNVLKARGKTHDLTPALWLGALLSACIAAVWVGSFQATAWDVALMSGLGVFQLAVPCLLAVVLARHLNPAELSLLSLMEVVFGILWAWLWAQEAPSVATLVGGALVLLTLASHSIRRADTSVS